MNNHISDFAFVDSQVEEFEKLAFAPKIPRALKGKILGSVPDFMNPIKWSEANRGRAIGILGGSALGAGAGAASAEEGNRGVGAISGALAGGLLGAGAGQVATGQGRRQIGRFGQRQLHSMTGYLPGTYKKEKGILSAFGKDVSPGERMDALRRMRISDIPELKDVGRFREAANAMERGNILDSTEGRRRLAELGTGFTGHLPEKLQRAIANLGVRSDVAKLHTAEKGLTGAPQYIKNLVTDPRATLTTGALTTGGLGVGLGAGLGAPEMIRAYREGDPEAFGASAAENLFYATGGPMPMLGQMVLGGQARRIGALPGAAYKKLTGRGDETSQGLASNKSLAV